MLLFPTVRARRRLVKAQIVRIEIPAVQLILHKTQRFTEA
ncbi:hypothetical protein BRYFOR_09104 [Marvinbryantia formatexigens DSM 14469]|uniref:Uncharacterized protein n=1 Tax=Marvinbryantia formatexigens DSM 14469 TaxID=478749 RepID=C6LKB6_9FIRM|nr:hypothetical protein BRYFOR_09104 [Marvinbryantia formatexigens DSM 14469]